MEYVVSQEKNNSFRNTVFFIAVAALVIFSLIGWYWSQEPDALAVNASQSQPLVIGATTTSALINITATLRDTPGG